MNERKAGKFKQVTKMRTSLYFFFLPWTHFSTAAKRIFMGKKYNFFFEMTEKKSTLWCN